MNGYENLYLVKGSKNRKWREPNAIDCRPATHITCSDLDKDGFHDLLLTYFNIGRAGGVDRETLRLTVTTFSDEIRGSDPGSDSLLPPDGGSDWSLNGSTQSAI